MKNKKQKLIPKNVIKNIAVISCVGTVLKSAKNKTIDDLKLERRCSNAMKVFAIKAGSSNYTIMANTVKSIWDDLVDNYSTKIQDDATIELARTMTNIMSPKVFKELMAYPQPSFGESNLSEPEDYKRIFEACIRLDEKLNTEFGTKPIILTKPKEKKVKVKKIKHKSKSKKQIKHEQTVLADKESKARIKSFLKQRVALALKAKNNS